MAQRRHGRHPGTDALYFAFVNYTTLSYGNRAHRALAPAGPITATNGIVLFGWSTAVILEILRQSIRVRDGRDGP